MPNFPLDTTQLQGVALICCEYTDEEYKEDKCGGSDEEYNSRVGQHYKGRLWRHDILPVRYYLSMCASAAKALGQEFLDNFLEHSYLADRQTSIKQYLHERPDILHLEQLCVDDEELQRIQTAKHTNSKPTFKDNYVWNTQQKSSSWLQAKELYTFTQV